VLLTGEYKVAGRGVNARQSAFSVEKDVTIVSGEVVNLDL